MAFDFPSARQNAETLKYHIRNDLFNYNKWEVETDCGTARCIGGWCRHLAGTSEKTWQEYIEVTAAYLQIPFKDAYILCLLLPDPTVEEACRAIDNAVATHHP